MERVMAVNVENEERDGDHGGRKLRGFWGFGVSKKGGKCLYIPKQVVCADRYSKAFPAIDKLPGASTYQKIPHHQRLF